MSVHYQAVLWNRQKRIYDVVAGSFVFLYLGLFVAAGAILHPNATAETLLIRALGTLAFFLLHVILCIGPLCRLDPRFLPLLYNRRHLGVMMFVVALAHGVFSLVQFHAWGDVHPLVSLLASNTRYGSLSAFPFQTLGFGALCILFLMAATSHDFWLHALTPQIWKRLHMGVYAAYGLLIGHVSLGVMQSEINPLFAFIVCLGFALVSSLHIASGWKERATDKTCPAAVEDGFVAVCRLDSIPDNRARVVAAGGERIAVFRRDGKVSALSNVCRHQNGPLGEGRIIDGCVTCPWHGYQYDPDTGVSPPPFQDKVETFRTKVVDGMVFVHPEPQWRDGAR